jgi:hypothetical protein
MAKKLSELLSDLSTSAQNAEAALAGAQKEVPEKMAARKEQARAAATKAIEKVNQEVKSVGDTASKNWSAVRAKVAADMTNLKSRVVNAKHDLDVKRAENQADRLEWEAGFAIDYAIASVEQARLAVLDAIDGGLAVKEARNA